MYADDTEMEDSCKPEDSIKLETNLNSDLSRLKEYFNKIDLVLMLQSVNLCSLVHIRLLKRYLT